MLRAHKRRQARIDRQLAGAHGLEFRVLHGKDIRDELIADYFEGHRRVCSRYGGQPWLSEDAYEAIVSGLRGSAMLMAYVDSGKLIAGILALQEEGVMYLLQWSERVTLAGLALDLLCHRPIEYAIDKGIHRIDSGLAADHKRLRGWQDVPVYHAHWFANDELRTLAEREVRNCRVPPPFATE